MAIDQKTAAQAAVRKDETYTVAQFLPRVGLSRSGLRACERRGLRTVRSGNRKYISGRDWHEYLKTQQKEQEQ